MIGALIGAGASIIGGALASKGASDSSDIAEQQLAQQAAFNQRQLGYAGDAFDREQEYLDYLLGMNETMDSRFNDFLDYQIDWADLERSLRMSNRAAADERMGYSDQLNWAERQRQLQREQYNQELLNQEYQRALAEMAYSQDIAMSEQAFDMTRLAQQQALMNRERDFQEDEFARQQAQLMRERNYELARQEQIIGMADQLGSNLERQLRGLGTLQAPDLMGEEDFNRQQRMFMEQYGSAADRAADRIASVNEAQLINRGMDTSTTGNVSRRDLLEQQVKPLYDEMVAKATQDALNYITGMNQNAVSGYEANLKGRGQSLQEVQSAYNPQLAAMLQLRAPSSATSNDWANIDSALIDRQLLSGNDFKVPITPGSRQQGIGNYNIGMSDQLVNPINSFGSNPASQVPWNAGNYFNPMSNMTTAANFMGQPSGDPAAWAQNAASSWEAAGQNFGNAFNQIGGAIDELDRGWGSTSPYDWDNGGRNWHWVN